LCRLIGALYAKEKLVKTVALIIFFFAVNALAATDDANVFSYSTTTCHGTCPAYNVKVFSDGVIVFNGEAYTKLDGIYRLPDNKELFQSILKLLDQSNFYEFNERYGWAGEGEVNVCEQLVTDNPNTILAMQYANRKKTIYHYHGCIGFKGEAELIALEKALFEIIGLQDYVGT
jgi:hypothetical protein